jgi:broad specificity phosphatase PhoE
MSVLTLVRHGQARPFEKDSDRLSETGELQARALGEYWKRLGVTFDEVWCGSLRRHCQTQALACESFPDWPQAQVSEDWNEYPAETVIETFGSPIEPGPDRNKRFQKMFEGAMLSWLNDTNGTARTYREFRERVLRGLKKIQEGPSNRRVVVFTSGGPIGLCVQTALAAPEQMFLEVNWRVRNCSLTEFVFSNDRLSLDLFNATPHLTDANLQTFR